MAFRDKNMFAKHEVSREGSWTVQPGNSRKFVRHRDHLLWREKMKKTVFSSSYIVLRTISLIYRTTSTTASLFVVSNVISLIKYGKSPKLSQVPFSRWTSGRTCRFTFLLGHWIELMWLPLETKLLA